MYRQGRSHSFLSKSKTYYIFPSQNKRENTAVGGNTLPLSCLTEFVKKPTGRSYRG